MHETAVDLAVSVAAAELGDLKRCDKLPANREASLKRGKTTLLHLRNEPSQELSHFPSPDVFALRSFSYNLSPCQPVHVSKCWPSSDLKSGRGNNAFLAILCVAVEIWKIIPVNVKFSFSVSNISKLHELKATVTVVKVWVSLVIPHFWHWHELNWAKLAKLGYVSNWDLTRPGLNISPCFSYSGYLSSETPHNRPV